MDIILITIASMLLLVIAFIFINYKRHLLYRKKTKHFEENKYAEVFEDAFRFIEQHRLTHNGLRKRERSRRCYDNNEQRSKR